MPRYCEPRLYFDGRVCNAVWHNNGSIAVNILQWIDRVGDRLEQSGAYFGHGTDNARDEAVWLVLSALQAPVDGSFRDWQREPRDNETGRIWNLLEQRLSRGVPLAYLIGTAHFAGLEFESGPAALVPRSPIAELITEGFRPWVRPERLNRVLDLCTGSACIAIAIAHYLPSVQVDAADISQQALALAARNVARHRMEKRVMLLESDLFADLEPQRYDLIVANPPYVPRAVLAGMPPEYRAEPELGLVSGEDGLDATLRILLDAPAFLGEDGVLICEVGESEASLTSLLPGTPFLWLEFRHGGSGVFIVTRAELEAAASELSQLNRDRENVA